MNINEILSNAKCILFHPKETCDYKQLKFCESHETLYFGIADKNNLYYNMPKNSHHYTTKFHYERILPALSELLGYKYTLDNYKKVENFCNSFNLSYYKPNFRTTFKVCGFEYDIEYDCDFHGLLQNKKVEGLTWITPYHKLCAFPHSCSKVVRTNFGGNGKKLLISGDSQMIPSWLYLCTIYDEVWYFDKRCETSFANRLNNVKFDDVLFAMYNIDLEKYINNLK